jgi:hypothetical protein
MPAASLRAADNVSSSIESAIFIALVLRTPLVWTPAV